MAYYPPEIIQKVKQMDLLTYLKNYEPEELVQFNRNTFMTKTHDSLKISNGMWYWFSRGIGGKSALEYLIQVKEYSFLEAVETIVGKVAVVPPRPYKSYSTKKENRLYLPKKAPNNDKAKAYLVSRGIDENIIQECIDNDLIYQDYPNNNVVFVGYDNNKNARYAMCRGTNESRYMKEATGSHKAFSFRLEALEKTDKIHLFESAIDLLSYATLMKIYNLEWYNETLISLGGVYQPAKEIKDSSLPISLKYYLNEHPEIKKIILHLDNDNAGRNSTLAIQTLLKDKYEIIDDPPKVGKDVNDFLCKKLGINPKKNRERER